MRGYRVPPWLVVGLTAGIVCFVNLGGPRLWDRDEPRNAGCAREMLERGDWVTPYFNATLRGHKPVLLYWLIMSAYSVMGVDEFSARFWSAVFGVGTSLLTASMAARCFGTAAGVIAGTSLATSLMFVVASRAATPDAALIFFTTLGIAWYVRHALPAQPTSDSGANGIWGFPRRWGFAVIFYGVLAVGTLAKGPVAFLLPACVVGAFELWLRRPTVPRARSPWQWHLWASRYFLSTAWRMRPLTGLLMLLLVAGPWYAWVGWRTNGAFLREFFWEHNLHRATSAMEGHDGPIFYYLFAVMAGFFPWSIFLGPMLWEACRSARREGEGDPDSPAVVLMLCWIGVWIGAFSLVSTKLPSYITPCYPALAALTGRFLDRWRCGISSVRAFWVPCALGILAAVGVGLLIGLPIAAHFFLPGEEWLALVGLIPLSAAAVAWSWRNTARGAAIQALTVGAVSLCVALFAVVAQRVDRHQQMDQLLAAARTRTPEPQFAAYGVLEPSWVFYAHRPFKELPVAAANSERNEVSTFLATGCDRFVITTRSAYDELQRQLPSDVGIIHEVPYFLRNKHRLVLLGRLPVAR